MIKHIPNLLTLSNLFFGCCALVWVLYGRLDLAAWCTTVCFVCDYFDGMVARALKINSPLGKELDSLADVVSFGVVPGAMIFSLLNNSAVGSVAPILTNILPKNFQTGPVASILEGPSWLAFPAFILSACAGLRLAKFNLDTRQTNYFIGLSTPACTVFVMGLALTAYQNRFDLRETIQNQWFLYAIVGLFSWLMLCEIPMFGMKIKNFDLKSNIVNLIYLAVLLALVFVLKELALSAIIVLYMLGSVFFRQKIVAKD